MINEQLMSAQIQSIKIKLNEKVFELSLDDARSLLGQLKALFPEPVSYPVYIQYPVYSQPVLSEPKPWEITWDQPPMCTDHIISTQYRSAACPVAN